MAIQSQTGALSAKLDVDPAGLPGARPAKLPAAPKLQLASAVMRPPSGDEWLHEIKFDGYRMAATLDAGEVRLTTRNQLPYTERFPEIVEALADLPVRSAVLDGEIVALRRDGRSDFGALQRWLGVVPDDSAVAAGVRVVYQVFDLLYLEGHDLKGVALEDRKAALASLLAGVKDVPLLFSEHLELDGEDVFDVACNLELEGIVSKLRGSTYRPGRQRDWLKCTCLSSGDFVVGGYTAPRGSRQGFGALLLGEPDDDGLLRYVGKVGTGFDDALLTSLSARLDEHRREDSPFATPVPRVAVRSGVTWVEPALVVEVAYSERTRDGYLRHPRFHSLRVDKGADDVSAAAQRPLEAPVGPSGGSGAERDQEETMGEKTAPEVKAGQRGARRSSKRAGGGKDRRAADTVAGVKLSNPDRVVYADQGVTKKDLAEYYAEVGEHLLRYARTRPLSLVRCPEGSEEQCFYQKHPGPAFASSLPRVPIEESEGVEDYLYLESVADIVALIQAGVLEIHAWGSSVDDLERPDQLVFDLDPADDVPLEFTKRMARTTRDVLAQLGLTGFLKATGGKGLHVVVPLTPDTDWDTTKAFAKGVAEAIAAGDPERLTTNMSKAKRGGKVFIDYLRNGRGATAIVPYSTRSRSGAPVAVPLRWDELSRLESPGAYDMRSVRRRLASLKEDPWAGFEAARRPLSEVLDPQEAL